MENINKKPKLVKVYLKQYQVDELDAIAKKKKKARSELVSCLIKDFIKKEKHENVLE